MLGGREFPVESCSRNLQGRRRQSVNHRHGQRHGRSISWSWCEIVVDGLSLFNGSQLAVDTTLVSLLRRDGTARPGAATRNGAASRFARKDEERTYSELTGKYGGCLLVVLAGCRRQVVSRDGTVLGSIGPCQGPVSAQVLPGKGSQSLDDAVERDPRMHGGEDDGSKIFLRAPLQANGRSVFDLGCGSVLCSAAGSISVKTLRESK